jgi:glycosyltransferase involved in cell wall biosynthesis
VTHACELTVVVPAFNEEVCLARIVGEIESAVDRQQLDAEILIVDDGSVDATPRIAAQLAAASARIRWVQHPQNRGSGQAIRTGLMAARGCFVIYVPADGQFHLAELSAYLEPARAGADVVVGARLERSDYTAFRLLSSRVYILLTNLLFAERFRDVNWVHLWRRELFAELEVRATGVYFLDEVLVRARRAGKRIVEIDSRYLPRQGGKAKGSRISTILFTIYEMLCFWWTLPRRRYQRR